MRPIFIPLGKIVHANTIISGVYDHGLFIFKGRVYRPRSKLKCIYRALHDNVHFRPIIMSHEVSVYHMAKFYIKKVKGQIENLFLNHIFYIFLALLVHLDRRHMTELIVYLCLRRPSSIHLFVTILKHILLEINFHMKTPVGGETMVCSNGPGHMTKIATMSYMAKTFKHSSFLEPERWWLWALIR